MTRLTHKQETFCRHYIVDLNATQAAIRAGYSAKTAHVQGSRLLAKASVQELIAELIAERNRRIAIDADFVLEQAVEVLNRCMQRVRFKLRAGSIVEDEEGNAICEFDTSGALKALDLIGKHVQVNAFKNNMEVSAKDDRLLVVNVIDRRTKDNLQQLSDKLSANAND